MHGGTLINLHTFENRPFLIDYITHEHWGTEEGMLCCLVSGWDSAPMLIYNLTFGNIFRPGLCFGIFSYYDHFVVIGKQLTHNR